MQDLFEKCMLLICLFVQRLIDRSKLISQRIPEIEQSVATFVALLGNLIKNILDIVTHKTLIY